MRSGRREPSRNAMIAIAIGIAFVLGGCDSDRRAISRDDLPEVSADPAAVVELGDDGFDVDELEIGTSDLVEFVNVGDGDHGIRTADSSIDTGLLFPGESTFVVFDGADRYDLVDVADDENTMTVLAFDRPPG